MTPTPFESVAHHLERSEVEVLKKENAKLTKLLSSRWYPLSIREGLADPDKAYDEAERFVAALQAERDKARSRLEEVTKERDEAKEDVDRAYAVGDRLAEKIVDVSSHWVEQKSHWETERDSLKVEVGVLMEGMELAWGVIANVGGGDWKTQSEIWQEAAERWREEEWHPALRRNIPPSSTNPESEEKKP